MKILKNINSFFKQLLLLYKFFKKVEVNLTDTETTIKLDNISFTNRSDGKFYIQSSETIAIDGKLVLINMTDRQKQFAEAFNLGENKLPEVIKLRKMLKQTKRECKCNH